MLSADAYGSTAGGTAFVGHAGVRKRDLAPARKNFAISTLDSLGRGLHAA